MKVLYLDCFSGASGDMFLGALTDAGASEAAVRSALDSLQVSGWSLGFEDVRRAGLRARQALVDAPEQERARHHSDIVALLENSSLPDGVRRRAVATFAALAEAEARVHGIPVEAVHFHEVGALDALVDIVGTAAALEDLAPDVIVCSPVATGRGFVEAAHGTIPVPAPAVVELLRGAPLVERGERELITPTGAAIIAASTDRFGPLPEMTLLATGYGAGSHDDPGAPNVLRVLVGEMEAEPAAVVAASHLVLETNLDDMSPELIPYAIERLLGAGAQDAWTSPIIMKKERPAVTLSVLCGAPELDAVLDVLYAETTTLGVRIRSTGKHELEREWTTVEVEGYEVRVKIGKHKGEVVNVAPEYEDAVKVARITGLPLKEIYRRAATQI